MHKRSQKKTFYKIIKARPSYKEASLLSLNALDASEAAGSVITAVSEGELTPIEATRVMGLIDSYRRTLELTEIEERLQALEEVTKIPV